MQSIIGFRILKNIFRSLKYISYFIIQMRKILDYSIIRGYKLVAYKGDRPNLNRLPTNKTFQI